MICRLLSRWPCLFPTFLLLQLSYAASYIPTNIQPSPATCALDCIDSFIPAEFRPFNCTTPPSLACLCSHYTGAGSALSDIVTSCTVTACASNTAPPIARDYCTQNQANTTETPFSDPISSNSAEMSTTDKSDSLNPAAIAGIAIGAVIFALIVFVLVAWLVSHKRKQRADLEVGQADRAMNIGPPTRFGTSTLDFAAPQTTQLGKIVEKRGVHQPFRPQPTIDTSTIGLAVTSEPTPPLVKTPLERTPISAISTDSTSKLLPRPPSKNAKLAGPRHAVQRRRPESTATFIDDSAEQVEDTRLPRASSANAPVELPCNNPIRSRPQSSSKPKNNPEPRAPPSIPVIKRQTAGRDSTQTIISPEPMSPTEPKRMIPVAPVTPMSATYDPARGYIPSYYYNDSVTPHQPTFPSPLHQTTFPASLQDIPEVAGPLFNPVTPPKQGFVSARSPGSVGTTLVDSVSPPPRPRRHTPPPLPPPPSSFPEKHMPPEDRYAGLRSKFSTPSRNEFNAPAESTRKPQQASVSPHRSGRESTASMTSIDTTFSDGESPPEAEETPQRLSPVPEAASSATSSRYPKVPPPSNQAVSRGSSKSPSPPPKDKQALVQDASRAQSSSPTPTIVAKRKGSDAEDEMKRGLWITGSNGRTTNDKGRFPVRTTTPPQSQEMFMTSPIWEPNLTPRRTPKGDLVLEVSMDD